MVKEYFFGVLSVTVFISLALGLAHPRLKNVTVFGAGVLVVCAIMLPLVDIIRTFSTKDSIDGVFDTIDYEATDSAIELAFEEGVAEYIAGEYGVPSECVTVRADGFDIGSLKAERIYVTLKGKAVTLDYKKIEAEVMLNFTSGGECEVSFTLG